MKSNIKTYNFEVIIKFHNDNGVREEKINAEGIKIEVGGENEIEEKLNCTDAKLVEPKFWRTKGKKARDLQNHTQIKDSIIFYDKQDMDEMRMVVMSVDKHHGKGVFVSIQPSFTPRIPVFIIDESFFQLLNEKSAFKKATVQFFPSSTGSMEKVPTLEHPLRNNEMTPSTIKHVPSSNIEPAAPEKTEKKGYLEHLKDSCMNYLGVSKPKSRDVLGKILQPGCYWTKCGHCDYIRAMNMLDEYKGQCEEIKEFFVQLKIYFESQKYMTDLVVLSFAAHLYICTDADELLQKDRSNLFGMIVKALVTITVDKSDKKMCEDLSNKMNVLYPHQIFSQFLKRFFNEILTRSQIEGFAEDKRHKLLLEITGILVHHCREEQINVVLLLAPYINNLSSTMFEKHLDQPIVLLSLLLLAQTTLGEFCSAFELFHSFNRKNMPRILLPIVLTHLEKLIKEKYVPTRDESIIPEVVDLFNFFQCEDFSQSVPKAMELFLRKHSFHQLSTFNYVALIWDCVDPEHNYYMGIRDVVFNIVEKDLKSRAIHLSDVINLMSSTIGNNLTEKKTFSEFADRAMKSRQYHVEEKQKFLNILYGILMKSNQINTTMAEKTILNLFGHIVKFCDNAIVQFFHVAKKNTNLFSNAHPGFLKELTKLLVTSNRIKALKCHEWAKIQIDMSNQKNFICFLTNEMFAILQDVYNGIDDVASWYNYIGNAMNDMVENYESFHLLREKLILSATNRWHPKDLFDVLCREKNTIEVLHYIEKSNNTVNFIKDIIIDWTSRFDSDELPICEIQKCIEAFDKMKWDAIEHLSLVMLPNLEELEIKLENFKIVCDSIQKNFKIKTSSYSDHSVFSILRGYNVDLHSDVMFEKIVLDCCDFDERCDSLQIILRNSLDEVRKCQRFVIYLQDNYSDQFATASYFLRNSSVFFQHSIGLGTWSSLTVQCFF